MQPLSTSDRQRLRDSFAENGYIVIENVVPKAPLAALQAKVVEEFECSRRAGSLFDGGGLIAGHINCFPGAGARFAYDVLLEAGVVDLVRDVFPKPFKAPNVGCNLNLPNSIVQHYHVDSGYLQDFMIVNVAAVDTNVANGAIELAPGTHKKFYKFWRFALERPHRFARRVPMQQGDVLVRTSRLWHRGMPNRSPVPRPMLALTFVEDKSDASIADPFRFNDGNIAFLGNWYRPTVLGRLRERAFLAAPFTYDAYRFVRSMFGDKGYTTA